MSDPKEQQRESESELELAEAAQDLDVPEGQGEGVRGGDETISFTFGSPKPTYYPQK